MNNLWISKYSPKTSEDIIGNHDSINIIKRWLKSFSSNDKSSIILSGPHGIGKSIAIKLILNEFGYDMKYLSSPHIKQAKAIQDIIQQSNTSINQILETDDGKKIIPKKIAVVVDDSETVTLTSEKNTLIQLYKDNEINKYFPLIFLTNEQHNKLVSDIKKTCIEIKFNYPTIEELLKFTIKIVNEENILIKNEKIYISIIKFSQYDIRRLLFILQDLKLTFNQKDIGLEEWKQYLLSSQKKDKDIGLFDATKKILDTYKNMDMCLQLYETEKVLLPLMIFENYPRSILTQKNYNDPIRLMSKITDSISLGDVIETNIYTDQNWYLQNLHGFYTCVETSFLLNKNQTKTNNNYHIDFSSDLNKTSLKNINKKNILSVQAHIKDKNLNDLLYLNKLINRNIKENNLEYVKKISMEYNLPWKIMEIIMKIDKTLEKINLTSKNKKVLQNK